MDSTAAPLQKLIEQFARLPGVGRKMAQRFAFYVLDLPEDKAKEFSAAILEAKSKIKKCAVCGNFTEGELCPICSAKGRDTSLICVVEDPRDVLAFEHPGIQWSLSCAAWAHFPHGWHRSGSAHH